MPTKVQAPALGPNSVVPHAGVLYSELAHVRRAYGLPIQQGTLLARKGAWDNKAVVAYVVYGGVQPTPYGKEQHVFTIGLLPLGKIFANGQFKLGKATTVREIQVETSNGFVGSYNIGGWAVVVPFAPTSKQAKLLGAKEGEFTQMPSEYPVVAPGGPDPAVLHAEQKAMYAQTAASMTKHKAAKAGLPTPPPAPEAILAAFLIPANGEYQ